MNGGSGQGGGLPVDGRVGKVYVCGGGGWSACGLLSATRHATSLQRPAGRPVDGRARGRAGTRCARRLPYRGRNSQPRQ